VSVTDLHPENLLDKEIRGELRASDRETLEAHLATCATCRFERQLRADFARELAADGLPPDIVRIVDAAAKRSRRPGALARSRRARPLKVVALVAAATLTLVAAAFAATESGRRVLAPLFLGPVGPAPQTQTSPAGLPAGHHGIPAASTSSAPPDPTPPPAEPTPQVAVESPAAAAPEASSQLAPAESPGSLFGAEAEARRRGDLATVLELHSQLVARYPASHETQVSRMTVAHMLLDRGDAARALSAFDAYLGAGSGELREDALAGRAIALDRLGRSEEGRRAWMALLDQYPGTAYAAHAQARIEGAGGN
jgi:TolA-binding protein